MIPPPPDPAAPTAPVPVAPAPTAMPAAAPRRLAPRDPTRETFAADELAVVLSHFDTGVISRIKEFPRGSRKAPKLLVKAENGDYLLKRRARGRDDPYKVAFTHELQLFLSDQQFPLPHLIGTRRENNSMLQLDVEVPTGAAGESGGTAGGGAGGAAGEPATVTTPTVYELFEYIPGNSYPQTLEATFEAGRVLSLYHKLLEDFETEFDPPTGSYHRAPAVDRGLQSIPRQATEEVAAGHDVAGACAFLLAAYRAAADEVERLGLNDWPPQVVHGDWHPGNMLFRDSRVVAVIDYDSARLLPRVIDVANGALQFSILGGDGDVARWPDYLDETRFKRFLRGYDEVVLLSGPEVRAVPHLMVEALIAEAVFPIAATGHFGRLKGGPFLRMVRRKVEWLNAHAARLVELAGG